MNKRLIAVGDIHGCFDSFQELIESKIGFCNTDKIILLGDYIDRGLQSKKVIDYIVQLMLDGYDIVPLMGNHELMLLDAYRHDDRILHWLYNGGGETLWSFGINSIREMPVKYLEFFRNLRYYYSYKEYLFVHAGFNDEAIDPFSDTYQMVWTRSEEYQNPVFKGKIIIHGHTPISVDQCDSLISDKEPVLNLDTGCVYKNSLGYGRLTALELYSNELYFV